MSVYVNLYYGNELDLRLNYNRFLAPWLGSLSEPCFVCLHTQRAGLIIIMLFNEVCWPPKPDITICGVMTQPFE